VQREHRARVAKLLAQLGDHLDVLGRSSAEFAARIGWEKAHARLVGPDHKASPVRDVDTPIAWSSGYSIPACCIRFTSDHIATAASSSSKHVH
jgi:hypothetical protein